MLYDQLLELLKNYDMQYATIEHCPYLYKEKGICEISEYDLTNNDSIPDAPRCKSNEELSSLLYLENQPFLEKATILPKTKAV